MWEIHTPQEIALIVPHEVRERHRRFLCLVDQAPKPVQAHLDTRKLPLTGLVISSVPIFGWELQVIIHQSAEDDVER